MDSSYGSLQRQFLEEEVKRLSKQFADCVKKKVGTQLKIEETEAEYFKELKMFQKIEEEMAENIHKLEDHEKDKEIEAKLSDLLDKDKNLKESIKETEESIKKLQSIKRTETNRIKCSERRVEALEKQYNTLVYTKKQLIDKIRRSVENQKL